MKHKSTVAVCLLAWPVVLFFAWRWGVQHDYVWHQKAWQLVLSGENPWMVGGGNAYGPAFNVFALLFALHPLAPKLFFCTLWIISVGWLALSSPRPALVLIGGLLSPFFWVEIARYGHFDIVVALCVFAAYRALRDRRDTLAGIWIGVAGALKFYPLVTIPFLAIKRPLRIRFLISALVTFAGAELVSWLIWREQSLAPFLYASQREPKIFSLYYFITTRAWPWQGDPWQKTAPAVMAIALSIALLIAWRRQLPPLRAGTLGLLVLLTAYPLGHPQFLTVFFLLLPMLLAQETSPRSLLAPTIVYLSLITLFVVLYVLGDALQQDPWLNVRIYASLPVTASALWLMAVLSSPVTQRLRA